jgi:hypothetical protein
MGGTSLFVNSVKYLGVTFNRRMTWRLHIEKTAAKALGTYIRTYSIFKSKHLSAHIQLIMYRALIRDYTCFIQHLPSFNQHYVIYYYYCWWGGTNSLGTAATSDLLYKPQMIDEDDCGAIGGMKDWQGKPNTITATVNTAKDKYLEILYIYCT